MSAAVSVIAADAVFQMPTFDYAALAPILILFTAAVLSVLLEAFLPRGARRPVAVVLVFVTLVAAFVSVVALHGTQVVTAQGSIVVDGPTLVMQGTLLLISLLGALLMAERTIDPSGDAFAARASALPGSQDEREFTNRGWTQTEIWPLFLFSVTGMLMFPAAGNLLMMFIALEVMSLPLYLLVGMARRRRLLSQEAALKYFVLGAFASALFLYGSALVYGFAGSISLGSIATAIAANPGQGALLAAGMGLVIAGLLFKIAAVPFHQWTPDVYVGAPTAVTGWMAATVKIAAFGALLRVLYVAFAGMHWDWAPLLWAVAILTMVLGSVVAIRQRDVKRMLAYSSIAQAGFILVGVIAVSQLGISSVLFYLIAYAFTTIGAFAIISIVRDDSGEATDLEKWTGLGKKHPVIATIFAVFMLALTGIPLTSGFIGKFGVFAAALESGATWLVVIGVLASLIAAFFYLRVIVVMFFNDPTEKTATAVVPSAFTTIALAAGATITVVLGVMPQPVIDLLNNAGLFAR